MDALGTYDAYRKFHVGESGMPVAENDVYTKVNVCDSKEDEAALVSTRELPVTMMEADGSEKEEKLPVGTKVLCPGDRSGKLCGHGALRWTQMPSGSEKVG